MKKEFEELRAAARCHDILQELVYDLMMKIDDMGDAISDAEDKIVDQDLENHNSKAVKALKANLDAMEIIVLNAGKLILLSVESNQGDEE